MDLSRLKNLLRKKPGKEEKEQVQPEAAPLFDEPDVASVTKIVERMKKKYEEEQPSLKEGARLRKIMEYDPGFVMTAPARELVLFENPVVRFFGKFYVALEKPLSKVSNLLYRSFGKKLDVDLQAAYMNFSAEQYVALALSAATIGLLATLGFMFSLIVALGLNPLLGIFAALMVPIGILAVILIIPGNKARSIANAVDKELPFALRHMSIEIRAGVSVFKTMESIAVSDYGMLSQGFRDVLFNVEKGMSTEDALERWGERTRSEGLHRMISHLVRALRTGGNLSEIMVTIAEDVSFERRMKIADFAEKLNLMSLFLMMVAVVFPALLTILTTIGSSPSIKQYLAMFSVFSPNTLALVYFLLCPMLLIMFIYFVKASDPGN